jgi:hypothetical protein
VNASGFFVLMVFAQYICCIVSKVPPKSKTTTVKDSLAKPAPPTPFAIPYPVWLLVLAVLVVYFRSFGLGYTELDDTIFVREFGEWNQDVTNIFRAFGRGLFDAAKDPYYRPIFSAAMILNYQLSGDSVAGYHVVNILLHMGAVILFYRLCLRLGIAEVQSFILGLVFSVHPVISQAVAWIPGRNDTLLAIFVLSFLLRSLRYSKEGHRPADLFLSALFLLCAYFTKETAVFAAPAALVLHIGYMGRSLRNKSLMVQYGVWVVCFGVWYGARAAATISGSGIGTATAFSDLWHRLPVILQYLGKILLPVNLSVFPTQQDTVLWYGIVAVLVLVTIVVLSRKGYGKAIAAGIACFFLFLMPALLVPDELNRQTFEHRLYLPLMGLLLVLPQTLLLPQAGDAKKLVMVWGGVCVLFAGLNYNHQQYFNDPLVFWTQAAETSPNSAYANMMLAARLDKSEVQRSEEMFRKAYKLNPKEKYLNFYMAEVLQRKDSVLASEPYLLAEKQISDYIKCDFYMARVQMEKGDRMGAIASLERYLSRDKYDAPAHNNLLLMLLDAGQTEKARAHIAEMKQMGMTVHPAIMARAGM